MTTPTPKPLSDSNPGGWPFPAGSESLADDWQHLKQYGYAPGGYMSRCSTCGDTPIMDKRALTCRPCAEAKHRAALQSQQPAGFKLLEDGKTAIPADWTWCRIEYEPGYPEDVAFGPPRLMDRLKKWLDKHFANLAALNRFHDVMQKHRLHPGRTDDDLLEILDAHLSAPGFAAPALVLKRLSDEQIKAAAGASDEYWATSQLWIVSTFRAAESALAEDNGAVMEE